ncbi:hypothetical protein RFI_27699 [Reticulomyxa filosa]|uniref:Helicase C-terminal domain-containing protein n=1 Tax=Reticulomyxa filosa TaxID=46433 RepID=X6M6Q8_RETFI|nr:hypothetical protein RFI_27699 [Reticulomyxa filosa]|eukprot:ETO09678.1 hypothetical protein RFI_27699 [Reticulomyxa filosa]
MARRIQNMGREFEMVKQARIKETMKEWEKGYEHLTHELNKPDLSMALQYGTKQAHLIAFVREVLTDPKNRVIIFSLWDSLLRDIKAKLHGQSINATVCAGTVHARRQAIKAFQENVNEKDIINKQEEKEAEVDTKTARVILLSIRFVIGHYKFDIFFFFLPNEHTNNYIGKYQRHAASGANLTLATHVILVDPVPGTSSESWSAERYYK